MQMKADERNKSDLQCDLGSSFEPKQRFSAFKTGRDRSLYDEAVYCTFCIEKKRCVAALYAFLLAAMEARGKPVRITLLIYESSHRRRTQSSCCATESARKLCTSNGKRLQCLH